MKKIFKLSNLSSLLLVVYIVKSFVVEPNLFDFGVIALMSFGFMHKLNIEKREVADKEEVLVELKKLQSKLEEDIIQVKKIQNEDRMIAETKFSTLNLSVQRPNKPKENTYGWGR